MNTDGMPRLCLFRACEWIHEAFPAERVVLTYDTGRKGDLRYIKSRLEVIDATHVVGRIDRWNGRRYVFSGGVWHVDQIDGANIIRVEAFNADYSTLLNTFVKPGCGIPEATSTKEQ